ncbi:MAG: metal-dependent hydrolase [Candidatus Methanoliparum thermophilum]|uniref:Metal-dependent hydrolase n=1 Tax=Methanoliparum thermophilum TaxID=2491083 RepID=A0A520KTG7_METT2|nr:MAG: metal-dependent hydrolase [Candidatus Methanoliparum thermophilum]
MHGKNHFIISLFFGILFILIVYYIYQIDWIFLLIFLLGTMTGSLIPDIDATYASIYHTKINDKSMNKFVFFTFVNPVISRVTKVMLKPFLFFMQKITDGGINDGHRGITHSIIGVFLISLIWFIIILSIYYIINTFILKIPDLLFYMLIYPIGMFFGGLCHLFEDSFTRSGIRWFQPFSNLSVRGSIKTGEREDIVVWYFIMTVIISSILLYIYGILFTFLSILLFLIIAIVIWRIRIVKYR